MYFLMQHLLQAIRILLNSIKRHKHASKSCVWVFDFSGLPNLESTRNWKQNYESGRGQMHLLFVGTYLLLPLPTGFKPLPTGASSRQRGVFL
jgi:hypothetical protein